jgi:hypothetical protein
MKKILFAALFALVIATLVSAQSLKRSDVKRLEGGKWIGTLTYRDYASGKPVSIRSNLSVSSKTPWTWTFAYEYPDEPKANSSDDVTLSENGKTFDGEAVVSRSKRRGSLTVVTTARGKDNDRPATIRHTYVIETGTFTVKKEVLIDGEMEYFERHTYAWKR